MPGFTHLYPSLPGFTQIFLDLLWLKLHPEPMSGISINGWNYAFPVFPQGNAIRYSQGFSYRYVRIFLTVLIFIYTHIGRKYKNAKQVTIKPVWGGKQELI